MSNPKLDYFSEQDVIHLTISEEVEVDSIEISPNITAELNQQGELIGVEILKASVFLRDFVLETTQAKLLNLQQHQATNTKMV